MSRVRWATWIWLLFAVASCINHNDSDAKRSQAAVGAHAAAKCPAIAPRPREAPLIGVNGVSDGEALVVTQVEAAGGRVLRFTHGNQATPVDGLVLVGGRDLDPRRYGEPRHRTVRTTTPERAELDFALLSRAQARRIPVLGICLGAQELWVAHGGTLVQDLPSEVGTQVNHRARSTGHPVTLRPGSLLAKLYGDRLSVFSNHHQAPDGQAQALVVTATSPDGVIEAFEQTGAAFAVGVGWHPEHSGHGTALFRALVVEAARARQARGVNLTQ